MPNKMLIDASHREETRVVVVRGNRIEEFDFESQDKKQLKGNIYLARVTRVEPSLQAAFVEYGGNRHGFLAFSEIHPDYYQIPVADRQALLRAEAEASRSDDEDDDEAGGANRKRRRGGKGRRGKSASEDETNPAAETGETPAAIAAEADSDSVSEPADNGGNGGDNGNGDNENGDGEVELVGAEDAIEEAAARRRPVRKHYKIQEVIKRRQILLVQVVKEERGNKGAALTTYLSLAGRYSVLMPNTARGGGISRKITNAQDRKRLKSIVQDLSVPDGMGVILRTAGESRTKAEIKRDYEYLMRLWENVRGLTLQSTAPALVYEEGSLIKRSVRDLYNKDIDQVLVAGEDGYREAKDFMRMLMPSHAKVVQPYRDRVPIFARNGIEAQLDRMVQPQVTLKSGGYVIINQTEALVAIDVNSGRSTKEHSIEDTALQTNLEAAEEVARQLRLRDLAGLIVIDFIDMEENRNNRAVEKKLKDCLKNDRARIQVGRISHFGLLEMSRQRIRASVLESTMQPCPHCGGTGHIRSESSVALLVVRAIEEFLLKDSRCHITVRTPSSTALYVLNHKRTTLNELETQFGLTITIEADDDVGSQHYSIVKGAQVERPEGYEPPVLTPVIEMEDEDEADEAAAAEAAAAEEEEDSRLESDDSSGGRDRKRRRRRRRRGRDQADEGDGARVAAAESGDEEDAQHDAGEAGDGTQNADAEGEGEDGGRKKRRRGKRGGRRNRRDEAAPAEADQADMAGPEAETSAQTGDETGAEVEAPASQAPSTDDEAMAAVEAADAAPVTDEAPAEKPKRARRSRAKPKASEAEATATAASDLGDEEAPAKPKRRTSRKKAAPEAEESAEAATQPAPEPEAAPQPEPESQAEPDEAPAQPEPQVSDDEESRDAEPVAAGEPVVESSGAEESDAPRKRGWWQRRGFF